MSPNGLSDVCANCGSRLEPGVWHPCETERDDRGGTVDVYTFCCEDCREDWAG